MNIKKLLELAKKDDDTLALHAKWWVQKKSNKNCEDPVSIVLKWESDICKAFRLLTASIVVFVVCCFIYQSGYLRPGNFPFFLLHMVIILSVGLFGSMLVVITSLRSKPVEVKEFIETINELEVSPGKHDPFHRVYSEEVLGEYPLAIEWKNPNDLKINAERVLIRRVVEIKGLQSRREDIPWRVRVRDEEIEAKRDEFRRLHTAFLRLLDIPEDWDHYFKNKQEKSKC